MGIKYQNYEMEYKKRKETKWGFQFVSKIQIAKKKMLTTLDNI